MTIAREIVLFLLFVGSVFWAIQVHQARRRAGAGGFDFSGPPERVWRVMLDHWFVAKAAALGLSALGAVVYKGHPLLIALWDWLFLITLTYWLIAQSLAQRVWRALPPMTGHVGPRPTEDEVARGDDARRRGAD